MGLEVNPYGHRQPDAEWFYYTGSDKLETGYALCFDQDCDDDVGISKVDWQRSSKVEKPATNNLDAFAGVVHPQSDGQDGEGWVRLITDGPAKVYTDQNITSDDTGLFPKDGSYALGSSTEIASSGVYKSVARTRQQVDRSGTAGLVQAEVKDYWSA